VEYNGTNAGRRESIMSKTIALPEDLYADLEESAHSRRMDSIVHLIRELLEQNKAEELRQRREAVQAIIELHERMKAKYGLVDDSTELIRQDRER
jgi:metal-responsive CopG/Arc/MetJ family transcriptional regulator